MSGKYLELKNGPILVQEQKISGPETESFIGDFRPAKSKKFAYGFKIGYHFRLMRIDQPRPIKLPQILIEVPSESKLLLF